MDDKCLIIFYNRNITMNDDGKKVDISWEDWMVLQMNEALAGPKHTVNSKYFADMDKRRKERKDRMLLKKEKTYDNTEE